MCNGMSFIIILFIFRAWAGEGTPPLPVQEVQGDFWPGSPKTAKSANLGCFFFFGL